MFQFPRFACRAYAFSSALPGFTGQGFPIRRSTDGLFPTTRGLSQVTTSFIASRCQGIHRTPLIAWPKNPYAIASPSEEGKVRWTLFQRLS